ncbi:MAG: stage V sporulation protein AA [Defluviitaleaceae bacterium]|nr:stage V sporulation protein AA [Defluviitaleaceae bacterium]MCL2199288.1 stage V sporulation protein AA [Defluviitaleaceae bacterium]
MNIYIKPKKKANLRNKNVILIKDVADVVAKGDEAKKIEKIKLQSLSVKEKTANYLVSVTDIIKKINSAYPNATVNNVGESDTWVHCVYREKQEKPLFLWLRVAIISIILFIGASTAIMSFHTDGQIPKIFERFYLMFYGVEKTNPAIITIPYSIGLAAGIILFYNHFFGKKITDDPTPIEVEIETYEEDVTKTMIDLMENRNDS